MTTFTAKLDNAARPENGSIKIVGEEKGNDPGHVAIFNIDGQLEESGACFMIVWKSLEFDIRLSIFGV